jgi:hypothetical protein
MQQLNLAWLDANVYSDDNRRTLERLRTLFDPCMEFIEEDECSRFLGRGVSDPRRFILIVSGALGKDFVSKVHDHENILSIYVYCGRAEIHRVWAQSYSKVGYLL